MRLSILLLGSLGHLASTGWVKWAEGIDPVGPLPRETGASAVDMTAGWTPKPTTVPSSESASRAVLELFRRQTTNTWINDVTCGYWPGTSSAPWTCQPGMTCATNDANVVACVSGTYEPFYTACFDYAAFQGGACSSIGIQTGCCQVSEFGACGTFLWSESPSRSMYRCFSTATIINILDEPQFVLDEATRTTSSSPTANIATVTNTGTLAPPPPSNTGGSSSTNVGAIVGGVIGGLALLSLLAVLLFCCVLRRRRRGKHSTTSNRTKNVSKQDIRVYNHSPSSQASPGALLYAPSTTHPSPGPSMSQHDSFGVAPLGATTFPPYSPYPSTATAAAAFHEGYEAAAFHQGYEAGKQHMVGQGRGQHHRNTMSPPLSPEGVAVGNPRHMSVMSELEGTPAYRIGGEGMAEKGMR